MFIFFFFRVPLSITIARNYHLKRSQSLISDHYNINQFILYNSISAFFIR